MIEAFFQQAGSYVHTNPWLAPLAVFGAGVLTASSPCVLAMIPLMIAFVAGRKQAGGSVARDFGLSMMFVSGLAITYTALGIVAALAGRVYGEVSGAWTWIAAAVCAVMGLQLMGVLKFTLPMPLRRQPQMRGWLGALVLGLLFGLVSSPCAAPILIVVLTYLAGSGASVPYGALLLLMYALGHSVLIVAAGTSMGLARKLIESRRLTRVTDGMRRGAGALIVLVGLYFAYKGIGS